MGEFRYQARAADGEAVSGVIDAESRQGALDILSQQGLFPSRLDELARGDGRKPPGGAPSLAVSPGVRPGGRISRKELTAFTREMATLLQATIPIPAALQALGQEEANPALKRVLLDLDASVRKGNSLSASLEAYPKLFPTLYSSMIRVGEEAGALDKVTSDLADLLEHEDEIRGEVVGAVAYPCFVLAMGLLTTLVLLLFVFPSLFGMLEGMVDVLPLPTRILLGATVLFQSHWPWILGGTLAAALALRFYLRTPAGKLFLDSWKLRLPLLGAIFRASALGRFSRTLGTLVRSGVSILPALEIVRSTIGNRLVEKFISRVSEETRGGDSLAAPLRKLGIFPPTMVQMIAVGEETGRLDEMLIRIASMEERQMRGLSRTLVSLLAPVLILFVGALVGFIVIALLLPIFRMSQGIH